MVRFRDNPSISRVLRGSQERERQRGLIDWTHVTLRIIHEFVDDSSYFIIRLIAPRRMNTCMYSENCFIAKTLLACFIFQDLSFVYSSLYLDVYDLQTEAPIKHKLRNFVFFSFFLLCCQRIKDYEIYDCITIVFWSTAVKKKNKRISSVFNFDL